MTTPLDENVRSIFVYGTLRPGQSNYDWTVGDLPHTHTPARLAGYALRASLPMFPYAVHDLSAVTVGDLLTFDDEEWGSALHACDALEGYPAHYDRTLVWVDLPEAPGISRKAWVYHAPADRQPYVVRNHAQVPGNDWVAAMNEWSSQRPRGSVR